MVLWENIAVLSISSSHKSCIDVSELSNDLVLAILAEALMCLADETIKYFLLSFWVRFNKADCSDIEIHV